MNHANLATPKHLAWTGSLFVSGALLPFCVSHIRDTMLDCHMHQRPNCCVVTPK